MIRLWHPMTDPHHCTYRLLTLLMFSAGHKLGKAKLSLLDLFYLFPHYLNDIPLPEEMRNECRAIGVPKKSNSFVHLPDHHLLYRELQTYQRTALGSLIAKGLVSNDSFKRHEIELNEKAIPIRLKDNILQKIHSNSEILNLLINQIGSLPLEGSEGLLRKSGLEMGGKL